MESRQSVPEGAFYKKYKKLKEKYSKEYNILKKETK